MSSRHQADSSPRSLPDHAFLAVASYVLLRFGHMSLRTQRCWQLQRVLRPWIGRLLANLLVLCSLFVLAPCATGAIQLTALLWRAGEKVLTDDGFYAVPNWHINGFSWPIAVPVGYPLSAATLYVTHSPNSTPYQMILVGCGQYGVSFTSGVQGIGATNAPFTVRFDVSSTDPLSTCVKKFDYYLISWLYFWSLDGNDWFGPSLLGNTTLPIYVTLYMPFEPPYRTAVDIACSTEGANIVTTAIANTWSAFSGRAITNWLGLPLYYYEPNTIGPNNAEHLEQFLALRRGQCTALADLFEACLHSHGISYVDKLRVEPNRLSYPADQGILVKKWSEETPSHNPPYRWQIISSVPGVGYFEMCPKAPSDDYGDLESEPPLYGQNSGADSPSEKVFGFHQVVRYGTTLYDPSYGSTYTGLNDMESKAIHGFFSFAMETPIGFHVDVRRSAANGLRFF